MNRKSNGSGMLVLVTAVTVGLVLGLIFFGLNFVRLTGSGGEQRKAIEAAALAAANDISRIVINTTQFGYVSITDSAPVGKTTKGGDNFFLQVRSINTLMGTARLEKMLASVIAPSAGDPGDALNYLADQDYANTQSVAAQLEAVLVPSLTTAGSPLALDINGAPITPYTDALAAYQNNNIRIAGQSSYVANSLKLTLGQSTQQLATNIPVPVSTTCPSGNVPPSSQISNFYKSNVNVPFGGNDYVFMAIGSKSSLLDPQTFVTSLPGLPYQYPSIVKAEAQQTVVQANTNQQEAGGSTISSASCAEPASIYDPLPAPGAMSFSFPDGNVSEITSPMVMLTNGKLNSTNLPTDSTDLSSPIGGDYPAGGGATGAMAATPWFGTASPGANPPAVGVVFRGALFDWFRRAGTKANLDSVVAMLNTPFAPVYGTAGPPYNAPGWRQWIAQVPAPAPAAPPPPPPPAPPPPPPIPPPFPTSSVPPINVGMKIPQGIMHIYKFAANGTVGHTTQLIAPFPYPVASQNQFYGVSYSAFVSTDPTFPITSPNIQSAQSPQAGHWGWWGSPSATATLTDTWDIYVRDECRQPGTLSGGQHAGEPLENAIVAMAPGSKQATELACADKGGSGSGAGQGGPGQQGPGAGAVPVLTEQDGWGKNIFPYEPGNGLGSVYTPYMVGPAVGDIRPTYATNGTAFDVRFRRQIALSSAASVSGVGQVGYIADVGP